MEKNDSRKESNPIISSMSETEMMTKQTYIAIFCLFCLVFASNLISLLGQECYRDFAVIFEGGYRISLGQVPYKDFFIPTGPVVYYVQAFFNLIFGFNIWSMGLHASFLAAIIAAGFYVVTHQKIGMLFSFILAFSMYLTFNYRWNYPWYNQTALFFYLIIVILLYHSSQKNRIPEKILVFCSVLTVLSLYSKQDVGLLSFGCFSIYFGLFSTPSLKKSLKNVLFYYVVPAIILAGLIALIFNNLGNFTYWFNLGQPPHSSRLDFKDFLKPGYPYWFPFFIAYFLMSFVSVLLILYKGTPFDLKKQLGLLAILNITPAIIAHTSGLWQQTVLVGFPLNLLIGYGIILSYFGKERVTKLVKIIIPLVLFVLIAHKVITVRDLSDLPNNFSIKLMRYGLTFLPPVNNNFKIDIYKGNGYTRIEEGSYQYCPMRNESYSVLKEIRAIIEESDKNFINMTEFTFLYTDYNVTPPKGIPLWFHHGNTFFDNEIPLLTHGILKRDPSLILLQDTHAHRRKDVHQQLLNFYLTHGYKSILSIQGRQTPAGVPIEVLEKEH